MILQATCPNCGQYCDVKKIDVGIGPFEFWGSKENDVKIIYVSECCDEIVDKDTIDDSNPFEEYL